MRSSERIHWLLSAVVFNFILGIAFAKRLWLSDRSYPLTPFFHALIGLPVWLDYILTPALILMLLMSAIGPKPKKYLIFSLVLIAFLFLQDQGRLLPSFYEYSFLLLLIPFYIPGRSNEEDAGNGDAILNTCRFAIACIYAWSGIQKMNPLFVNDFSWFLAPVTNLLPFIAALLPVLLIVAPLIELSIGLGLIFKRTRKFALVAVLAMHASIFLLIGPVRGNWNDSAWAWNLGSALIVFVLFFRADDIPARAIAFNDKFWGYWVVLLFFGFLPALSLFNLWDSPLSFDVYSGNYFQAQIYVSEALKSRLSADIARYAVGPVGSSTAAVEPIDLYGWAEAEFNANPYPVPRILENVGGSLCAYAASPSEVDLAIRDKLHLSGGFHWVGGLQSYDCSTLNR